MNFLDIFASLLALIVLEIILGIDNLVFLAILTEKLPLKERRKARQLGLMFAWVTRLLLLFSAFILVRLTSPLFSIAELSFSVRDLFLIVGGGFLIAKATQEIHDEVNQEPPLASYHANAQTRLARVVVQVGLMDIIFSFDSILTAVGLTAHFWVMASAITIAIMIMIYASETVSIFIHKHPTIKMLALSFLILIGMVLVADGLSFYIPRGYIYFAMGFSLAVESLNWLRRSHRQRKQVKKK